MRKQFLILATLLWKWQLGHLCKVNLQVPGLTWSQVDWDVSSHWTQALSTCFSQTRSTFRLLRRKKQSPTNCSALHQRVLVLAQWRNLNHRHDRKHPSNIRWHKESLRPSTKQDNASKILHWDDNHREEQADGKLRRTRLWPLLQVEHYDTVSSCCH